MTSQQGGNVTMRIVNGDTYLNDAKVIATDYLVYNGVMHILEKPLNFSLPDAIPPPLLALSGGNTSTAFSNPPSQAKSTLPIVTHAQGGSRWRYGCNGKLSRIGLERTMGRNTQSPFDKQEREIIRNNMDRGVYRPSDHTPDPASSEGFGISRIMETNREIVPDTPIDKTYLERIITPEPKGGAHVRRSISISEEPRSPISPMSSLREGALSPSSTQLATNQSPISTTPTTSPIHDVN
ncbi:putative mitochondrial transport protein [Venturia nashicola]|uniref:Putative mitochondrial transport protein n=1 Tax=Venturia nashicola TaxID=86259 RepID=A0A4Z1P6L1_9PEZI|nr:putative mitochondrial transport protein [Venturia nashicola]